MTDTPTVAPDFPDAATIEAACEVMHDAYERAALEAGWATQARSRVPWADVPDANKATMRAAVRALVGHMPYVEPCICTPPPAGDGPVEDCPRHGRAYSYWVARADRLDAELRALRADTAGRHRAVRSDDLQARVDAAVADGRCAHVNPDIGAVCTQQPNHFQIGQPLIAHPHQGNGWAWT